MEHWFEYNVSFKEALSEIHRILKPGGILMINSPIHNHGDPRFLMGEIKKIKSVFNKRMWTIKLFERNFPKFKIQGWKKIAGKGFFSKFGYPNFLIPNSKNASTHTLNIHAQKKKGLRKDTKNQSKFIRNILVLTRFIKTYLKTRILND